MQSVKVTKKRNSMRGLSICLRFAKYICTGCIVVVRFWCPALFDLHPSNVWRVPAQSAPVQLPDDSAT